MPASTAAMTDQRLLIERDIDGYLAQHADKEILRLLTCGSVDDGKSTLIGRLLHDSQLIHEDQLAAVERESRTGGSRAGELDLALVVDGLQAEREQGITIDVAYRYFSTAKRKFIIADTPGHEQYTRNMATGASTCDAAIILIDAANGVLTQTRRHTFIARLLGIRHLIVAVNKMDLVDYDEATFSAIRDDYEAFVSRLRVEDLDFIPISALHGDNVVERSGKMRWYRGASLMHLLENTHIAPGRGFDNFRMPVQRVNRPDASFRGYSGTVASGAVRPGDAVVALPSGLVTEVTRIVSMDGDLEEAFPPMAVTVTLADQIDISRGDVLASPANQPRVSDAIDATLVWMSEEPMRPGKQYIVKHGTKQVFGRVETLRDRIDVNTLELAPASTLELNEIGRIRLVTSEPVAYDAYEDNRATGSFILINRLSNITVGAGMIEMPGGEAARSHWDETPHGQLTPTDAAVTAGREGSTPGTDARHRAVHRPVEERQDGDSAGGGAQALRRGSAGYGDRRTELSPGAQPRPRILRRGPLRKRTSRGGVRAADQRCRPDLPDRVRRTPRPGARTGPHGGRPRPVPRGIPDRAHGGTEAPRPKRTLRGGRARRDSEFPRRQLRVRRTGGSGPHARYITLERGRMRAAGDGAVAPKRFYPLVPHGPARRPWNNRLRSLTLPKTFVPCECPGYARRSTRVTGAFDVRQAAASG